MIDPRRDMILIFDYSEGRFRDRTADISWFEPRPAEGKIYIGFNNSKKAYPYGPTRARALRSTQRTPLADGARAEVEGIVWNTAHEVLRFTDPAGDPWSRILYHTQTGEKHAGRPASQVRILPSATQAPGATDVLGYWRAVLSDEPDDVLARAIRKLAFVHPESALGSYVTGAPIEARNHEGPVIFPFRCNLSQRAAVSNGLSYSISAIEGPPGTGKTETILNLIANITAVQHQTVGVVSYTNAAVDNVRDKLADKGFGHMVASLGRRERREEFFAAQQTRNARVDTLAHGAPAPPVPGHLAQVDERLRRRQHADRVRAERQQEVDAYRLELRHFEAHLRRDEVPDLAGLPLLRRSADRILDYLAETELEHRGSRPGLMRRLRKYFRYGSLRGLEPDDSAVVLRLQRAYYDKRIDELGVEIRRLDGELRAAGFEQLAEQHQQLSRQLLHADLGARYRGLPRSIHQEGAYRKGKEFQRFIADYPVLLSTCHSLPSSIADGQLLDYLIIDEASQVDPLVAGVALSCCRNLIVVGDTQQLAPIAPDAATGINPPGPAYDCSRHSILTSLSELYGDRLPRTLLREHYRCDPAIIGFCNKKFYDGALIPYTRGGDRPLAVWRTAEGNHMRSYTEGGRSNQREVDVIEHEVIPEHCPGTAPDDIGITTPYRRQADKAGDVLDGIDADTVHKFQGREKEVVIMSTVLDETWRGQTGMSFVDDPPLINVAVSRATRQFIIVTNHDMLPRSRHIRDLVGHIRYHTLDDGVADSAVVSVFDLLYQEYSQRLRSLAARLRNERQYKSEDIAWTVLHGIFTEEKYAHLTTCPQVLVRNLLPDLTRLTERQASLVRHRSSVDFVVYNRVTNHPLLAIEVDGFTYHENNPAQRERDGVKDEIFRIHRIPLLRLPTTGSDEESRIRRALDEADDHWSRLPAG